jgi:hypothetical protein
MQNRAARKISLDPALTALSRDAVFSALAGGDEAVFEAVAMGIVLETMEDELAGEEDPEEEEES